LKKYLNRRGCFICNVVSILLGSSLHLKKFFLPNGEEGEEGGIKKIQVPHAACFEDEGHQSPQLQEERSRWMRYNVYLHTSKVRYELKVVLLHLWSVNVKTIRGFIDILVANFFKDKTAP
jgi:hypothetical protein